MKEFNRREFIKKISLPALLLNSRCKRNGIEDSVRKDSFYYPHSGILGEYPIKTVIWSPDDLSKFHTPLPLIFMSHGFGSYPIGHVDLAKRLATNGYIVASPNHLGDRLLIDSISDMAGIDISGIIDFSEAINHLRNLMSELNDYPEFANLTPIEFSFYLLNDAFNGILSDEISNFVTWGLKYRLEEAYTSMKCVESVNKYDFRLRNTIDMSKIGLLGHSLGGYTVAGMSGAFVNDYSSEKKQEKQFDFSKYNIKASIIQSPACGTYKIENLNNIKTPLFWMVGELDKPAFNIAPENLFNELPITPQYFMRLENGGHLIYDDIFCSGEARDNVTQSVFYWLQDFAFNELDIESIGVFDPETYMIECSNYKFKQDLIGHYTKNFFTGHVKDLSYGREMLLRKPLFGIKDYFVK
ncbi:MAG: hypothetical protein QXI33_03135 [Candidatus Pacearchaeota archaeon]